MKVNKSLILGILIAIFAWPLMSNAQKTEKFHGAIKLLTTTNFELVANPLDNGEGNLVTDIFQESPVGTIVYKWNGLDYDQLICFGKHQWVGDTDMTLVPGEGVFLEKSFNVNRIKLHIRGDVLQGTLVNPVAEGLGIYSAMVPQRGGITSVHNYQPTEGDLVFQFVNGNYAEPSVWVDELGWYPSEPVIDIGEAFWIWTSVAKSWVREFELSK